MRLILFLAIISYGLSDSLTQEVSYEFKANIPYYSEKISHSDTYIAQQCLIDFYYPSNKENFSTIIWFHGGGLKTGDKHIPQGLKEQGVAVVSVKYRLYPNVKCPVYIEDAAAATAWVFKNIVNYGGDTSKIFLTGHSAGGYLASMLGMDRKYLQVHKVDANNIAGLIPLSGHTITHFTVREEQGIDGKQPIIDAFAPLFHVRQDAPPLLMITGDREMELLGRYEENAYMMRMMKVAGHKDTRIMELDGYGHDIIEPSLPLILNEVKRITRE